MSLSRVAEPFRGFMRAMELTEQARRALEVVRRDGRDLRYEVSEICKAQRYRLSVHYTSPSGEEIRLGLLYSSDRSSLEALGTELGAGGGSPSAARR